MTRTAAWGLAVAVALAATAWAGATEHLPALILRTLVAVAAVAWWPSQSVTVRRRDLLAPAVGLAVVAAAWLRAGDDALAAQSLVSVMMVVALYSTLLVAPRGRAGLGVGVAGVVAGVHALWAVAERGAGASRGSGGFFDPNDLAAFIAPLFVLSFDRALAGAPDAHPDLPAWTARLVGQRRFWIVAAAILLAGVLATGSRSGVLGAVAGALLTALVRFRHRRLVQVAALAGGLAVLALLGSRWLGRADSYAYTRTSIWQRSIALAWQHPLGVGLAGYADAMRVYGIPVEGWVHYPKVAAHAHSEPLNAWVELGWAGLVATILPALMVAAALRKQPGRAGDWGAGVAFAAPALLTHALHVQPVALLAALWAADVVRGDARPGAGLTLPGGRRGRAAIAVMVTLAVLAALPGAAGQLATQQAVGARARGDLPRALDRAELAARLVPSSPAAALLVESLRYLNKEPPLEIIANLLAIADRFPTDVRALERAVQLLEERTGDASDVETTQRWATVVELRRALVHREPHNAVFRSALATALLRAGDADAATSTWREALGEEPNCAEALAHLALLAAASDNGSEARSLADRAWQAQAQSAVWQGYPARVLSLRPDLQTMLRDHGLPPS